MSTIEPDPVPVRKTQTTKGEETMTTTEQLQRIRAKCVELLAIAEKRTPGKWERAGDLATHVIGDYSRNNGAMICDLPDSSPDCDQYGPNATFIAACAGPAEAGWKATIAAIDYVSAFGLENDSFSSLILAAWKGIPCRVAGRDFGNNLIDLVERATRSE